MFETTKKFHSCSLRLYFLKLLLSISLGNHSRTVLLWDHLLLLSANMETTNTSAFKLLDKTRRKIVSSAGIQFLITISQFSQFSILTYIVSTKTSDLLNTLKQMKELVCAVTICFLLGMKRHTWSNGKLHLQFWFWMLIFSTGF